MAVKPKPLTIRIKRGDDFKLQMAIKDRRSDAALLAFENYESTYSAWRSAVNADPPDNDLIESTHEAMLNSMDMYDNASQVDITDWTITGGLAWSSKPVATLTCTTENAETGTFIVTLSREETLLLTPREYRAEIQFTRPDGEETSVISSQDFIIIVENNIVDLS